MKRRAFHLLPCLALFAAAASAQLVNPDFDTDILGWSKFLATGTTPAWDGSDGDPTPGSALLESAAPPPSTGFPGLSQCFPAAPGQNWTGRVRVKADLRPDDTCFVELSFHACDECVCPAIDFSSFTSTGTTVGWQSLTDSETAPATTQSVSFQIFARLQGAPAIADAAGRAAGGTSTCRFDSAELESVVYGNDFEVYPPDFSAIEPASCDGYCYAFGTPNGGGCYCDSLCLTEEDCCLDACSTCGECP